jgi:hypothetical protein
MTALSRPISRRDFLSSARIGIVACGAATAGMTQLRVAAQGPREDASNTHNMLVFGEQTLFLSHLPMFDKVDKAQADFTSPHRYQVILEARFRKGGKDVTDVYFKDRQANRNTRLYTLRPNPFVLSQLFTPDAKPRVQSFTAEVFRGHLEQDGVQIPALDAVEVNIQRVVHARKFDPSTKNPEALEYVLMGTAAERFLAHTIVVPPSFDQVMAVTLPANALTDAESRGDVRLVVPGRRDVVGSRLKEKEKDSSRPVETRSQAGTG